MSTRGTSLLKKKSIKNEKLYGRSSQSSRITPGSLHQFLSLIQASPPPLITYNTSLVTLTTISHGHPPNHQLHQYNHLPQHPQNHPLNHPHNHLFFLSGFFFTAIWESQGCRGRGRAFL